MNEQGSEPEQVRRWECQRAEAAMTVWGQSDGSTCAFTGYGVYPWEMRQRWEKMRDNGEPLLLVLNSLGSRAFCCSSKGIFIFTLCVPSVVFLSDSLWNPPSCWSNWNLCAFSLFGNENRGNQEVEAAGSYSPWSDLSDVLGHTGWCGHPCLQLLVIGALLLASAWLGEWGAALGVVYK